jgi:hypothetical protein
VAKVLQFLSPALTVTGPVAVVGSSASILGRGLGPEIDASGAVFRFNRQITANHEADVGTKTTLRFVNGHVYQSRPFTRWKVDQHFVRNLRDARLALQNVQPGLERHRAQYLDPSVTLHLFTYQQMRHAIIRTVGFDVGALPTLGLAAIFCCVLSGVTPRVYGWDLDEAAPLSHYWEPRDQKAPHHSHPLERRALRVLLEKKRIIVP